MNSSLFLSPLALRSTLAIGAAFLCAIAPPLSAQQDKASTVVPIAILEGKPTVISISPATTTTIIFPFEVDDIHGKGFTPDPAKVPGEYIVTGARPGTKILSFTGAADSKRTRRNLNVFAGGRVYVLMIEPAEGEVPAVIRLTNTGGPTAARNEVPGAAGTSRN